MTIMSIKFGVPKNELSGASAYSKNVAKKTESDLGEVIVILTLKPPSQKATRDPGKLVILPSPQPLVWFLYDSFREIRNL
jgi:hypothetical protein